jgi:hypothetical protein
MSDTAPIQGDVIEGEDLDLVAQVRRTNGVLIQQADIESISLMAFDLMGDDPKVDVYMGSDPEVASVIKNTPLLDGRWRGRDTIGYNFAHRIPIGDLEIEGGHRYRLEYALRTKGPDEGNIRVRFLLQCIPELGV